MLIELLDLDVEEGMQLLSQEDRDRRVVVKSDIDFLASSKALFIKEGDNNTRFFHILANSHR